MDQLIREDMSISDEAFSNIRLEDVEGFQYMKYAVISPEPEDDAIKYAAALIIEDGICIEDTITELYSQDKQKYIAITIKEPQIAPFRFIYRHP